MKALVDYILDEDFDRYNELIEKATEAKKNAPKKEHAPRAPKTLEQKQASAEAAVARAKAKLEALLAAQTEG